MSNWSGGCPKPGETHLRGSVERIKVALGDFLSALDAFESRATIDNDGTARCIMEDKDNDRIVVECSPPFEGAIVRVWQVFADKSFPDDSTEEINVLLEDVPRLVKCLENVAAMVSRRRERQ